MPRPAETPPVDTRHDWRRDFIWSKGRIEVRKTGVKLKIDRHLIAEVVQWVLYFMLLAVVSLYAFLGAFLGAFLYAFRGTRRRRAIWFTPDVPRPWYLIRGAALWAGVAVCPTRAGADVAIYFDDITVGACAPAIGMRNVNFACTDISKSHVATVFEQVFGYALAVDPCSFSGPMVTKSEKNGVHDGCTMNGPAVAQAGQVYQRLVDTQDADGMSRDLRTLCAGGAPLLVWVKVKPAGRRFAIHNKAAFLRMPDQVFSPAELALIRAFTARIGLEWGGLDILRDRHSGRIYIVDVNKTDVGPVIALSWRDKIRSMRYLARALADMVAAPLPHPVQTELGIQPGEAVHAS